jgi:hypothetical protein
LTPGQRKADTEAEEEELLTVFAFIPESNTEGVRGPAARSVKDVPNMDMFNSSWVPCCICSAQSAQFRLIAQLVGLEHRNE